VAARHDLSLTQLRVLAILLTGEISGLITPMTRSLSPADQKRLSTLLSRVLEGRGSSS
jgi:hypothetical protein